MAKHMLMALSSLACITAYTDTTGTNEVSVHVTTLDQSHEATELPNVKLGKHADSEWTSLWAKHGQEQSGVSTRPRIKMNTNTRFQEMIGYGGALTDASAYVLHTKERPIYEETMQQFFGTSGLNLNLLRITIGVSDFSVDYALGQQTYDDVDGDWSLTHFSIDRDRIHLIPVLRRAKAINPSIKIVASPWTAPVWLKEEGSNIGNGTLLNTSVAYETYARYLVKYVQSYRDEGITVDYLTLQNEPGHTDCGTMPCMLLDAVQEARLAKLVGLELHQRGLQSTRILGFDHNWDTPSFPLALLEDKDSGSYIDGVAWHCYGGNPSSQNTIHKRFPQKEVHLTECSGGGWSGPWDQNLIRNMNQLFIGGANDYGQSVLLWNLALDEEHGPRCYGGACCTNCRGVLTMPTNATSRAQITKNVEFVSLAHFSPFVHRGARRVETVAPDGIMSVGFVEPHENSNYNVLVVANPSNMSLTLNVEADHGCGFSFQLPPGIATFTWNTASSSSQCGASMESSWSPLSLQSRIQSRSLSLFATFICLVTVILTGALVWRWRRRSMESPSDGDYLWLA